MSQLIPTPAVPDRMSTKDIADLTGKNHGDVMRDVRVMVEQLTKADLLSCVEPATYIGGDGRAYGMYNLDRPTVECLVTGYDPVSRMKIIQRLHYLEDLQKAATPALPQTYAQALRVLADVAEQKDALQLRLTEQQPAVEAMQALTESGAAIDIGELAKTLAIEGLGRNNLYDLLRECEVIQPAPSTEPYQQHVNSGYFKRVQVPYEVRGERRLGGKTQVTPRGVAFVRRLIERRGRAAA